MTSAAVVAGAAQAAMPTSVLEPDSGPGSFKGMVSPFAQDTSPLDAEPLPSDDDAPDAAPDSRRTRSAGPLFWQSTPEVTQR